MASRRPAVWRLVLILPWVLVLAGCLTPASHRVEMDRNTSSIIVQTREQVLGGNGRFSVEPPSHTLRRKLLEDLSLPITGSASLGTDRLSPVEHWPEPGYPGLSQIPGKEEAGPAGELRLSLVQALEVGARNSSDYQTQKEDVFQAALALYLEQHSFRASLVGQLQSLIRSDASSDPSVQGTLTTGSVRGTRQFENGMSLTTAMALDLATLIHGSGASSVGIAGDASLSIPLLRGSARHIVTEPLKQAQQNLVYAILDFERFKTEYAVAVGSQYLSILQQLDTVNNTGEDYRSRIISARRSMRLADAGRLKEIEVDQAVQTELLARQRWVSAREQYKKQMDGFKSLLGLPPDAGIRLDPDELRRLEVIPVNDDTDMEASPLQDRLPAHAPVTLAEPDMRDAGPLEMDARTAIELALTSRLDMKKALGRVSDAQRAVVVAADALGAELTFLGSASLGERRTITAADLNNARLRTDKGVFSALLTLDLPFERTAEAVVYRNSFILLEQSVRDVQNLEDDIKLAVQSRLRELLEARETLYIQTRAVTLAQKRVKSITLFMDAGRAETRDLLEAQDALLSAQNGLTSARVNYRIAELEIQRDMGVLTVTDAGLWQEYNPEIKSDVKN
ncbi:MAG: TolC family protein [Pseudomonadota bacterium]